MSVAADVRRRKDHRVDMKRRHHRVPTVRANTLRSLATPDVADSVVTKQIQPQKTIGKLA